ncbi:MAG: hypothetical protein WCC57_13595, partial [Paracoccaceae bacterium]
VTRKARVLCARVTYANLCAFALRISEISKCYFEKGAVARLAGFAEIAQAVQRSITWKIVVFERIEIVAHQSEPALSNLAGRALNP